MIVSILREIHTFPSFSPHPIFELCVTYPFFINCLPINLTLWWWQSLIYSLFVSPFPSPAVCFYSGVHALLRQCLEISKLALSVDQSSLQPLLTFDNENVSVKSCLLSPHLSLVCDDLQDQVRVTRLSSDSLRAVWWWWRYASVLGKCHEWCGQPSEASRESPDCSYENHARRQTTSDHPSNRPTHTDAQKILHGPVRLGWIISSLSLSLLLLWLYYYFIIIIYCY